MKTISKMKHQVMLTIVTLLFVTAANAQIGEWNPQAEDNARTTIEAFKDNNSKMESFFNEAYGYAIFPTIAKGAMGIGGAHGKGIVFEKGTSIGAAKLTQVTLGFQWGGQAYSEVIFFENEEALVSFKERNYAFSGQVSAVAVNKGVSADIAYEDGVAVYTMAKGGLMYEASIGGQKFKYRAKELTDMDDSVIRDSE